MTGYIWLGNLQNDDTVVPTTVKLGDTGPVRTFSQLTANSSFVALNALFIRGGLPRNDKDYYRGQPIVGLVDVGTTVKLLDQPDKITRSSGLVQIWGHVEAPATKPQ